MKDVNLGDVRKLDGRPVVVIGVGPGDDVQVDHWSGAPCTPVVHVGQLREQEPHAWSDDALKGLQEQALQGLNSKKWRGLALGTISLIYSFATQEKREDDIVTALKDEGKTLDETARELEGVKGELHLERDMRTRWGDKIEEQRVEIEQLRADFKTLNLAHETALRERDYAAKSFDDLESALVRVKRIVGAGIDEHVVVAAERFRRDLGEARAIAERATADKFTNALNIANVKPYIVTPDMDPDDIIHVAISAVHELGTLSRFGDDVLATLAPILPANDSQSEAVKQLVAEWHERSAELAKLKADVQRSRDDVVDANLAFGPTIVAAQKPTTRTFTNEYLFEDLELPNGDNELESHIVEQQDHLVLYEIIFRTPELPNGYGWQTTYTVSTDDDEAGAWEFEPQVQCTLVRRGTKTIKAWIPAVMPGPTPDKDIIVRTDERDETKVTVTIRLETHAADVPERLALLQAKFAAMTDEEKIAFGKRLANACDLAEINELADMTPDEVDVELREMGLDPVAIGKRGAEVAAKCLAERAKAESADRVCTVFHDHCPMCNTPIATPLSKNGIWVTCECGAELESEYIDDGVLAWTVPYDDTLPLPVEPVLSPTCSSCNIHCVLVERHEGDCLLPNGESARYSGVQQHYARSLARSIWR